MLANTKTSENMSTYSHHKYFVITYCTISVKQNIKSNTTFLNPPAIVIYIHITMPHMVINHMKATIYSWSICIPR